MPAPAHVSTRAFFGDHSSEPTFYFDVSRVVLWTRGRWLGRTSEQETGTQGLDWAMRGCTPSTRIIKLSVWQCTIIQDFLTSAQCFAETTLLRGH